MGSRERTGVRRVLHRSSFGESIAEVGRQANEPDQCHQRSGNEYENLTATRMLRSLHRCFFGG